MLMRKIRRYSRYIVAGNGEVWNDDRPKTGFEISNMSASGISIITEADMEKNSTVSMNIRLSGNVSLFQKEIKGEIVRKQKQGSNYQYGIDFVQCSAKDMTEIDEYLQLNFGSARIDFPSGETEPGENPLKSLKRENNS